MIASEESPGRAIPANLRKLSNTKPGAYRESRYDQYLTACQAWRESHDLLMKEQELNVVNNLSDHSLLPGHLRRSDSSLR